VSGGGDGDVTSGGRIYNFSSGPAVLPEPVLRRAQDAIWDLDGTGIGILEHSHRGAAFEAVLARAEGLVRSLAGIPDDYAVLFIQGGATTQFFMAPMNFLGGGAADYANTGTWSQKAIKDARRYGEVRIACSSEADAFAFVPSEQTWTADATYAHFTSNETIHGTQWREPPAVPLGVPLFCDASSDIFSRPIDVTRYGLIYAGAQKNLGPSGVTLVIIRKDLAERGSRDLPGLLQYRTFVAERSMLNTPPTFGIYVLSEVLAWLESQGGLAAIGARNAAKAALLYDFLDASRLFRGLVRADSRSQMNVTFRTSSEALDRQFVAEATAAGFDGLAGHRSAGGMRASIYNAFPVEGVQALVRFMEQFEARQR
jgi:phosphoserine aminotransferase